MCRMCDWYGGGEIWYLNPKNYAHRLYRLKKPGEGKTDFQFGGADSIVKGHGRWDETLPEIRARGDMETFNKLVKEINERGVNLPGSQIVPLRDANAIMDLIQGPLGAMMCNCRYRHRAEEANSRFKFSCLGVGTGMLKWERWPERYKGGVDFMSPAEAKEWMEYWDKKGYVHILMFEGQDFVGGICNCDYPTCGAIRGRLDYGVDSHTVKGEYVAQVDYSQCNGCGVCAQRCQFGALKFEVTQEKANINAFRCFGCGLCETACPRKAIKLTLRKTIPVLKDQW